MVAAVVMSASAAAWGDTLTEYFTVEGLGVQNLSGYYGINSTSFDLFNPSLGTLSGVSIVFNGTAILLGASGQDAAAKFEDVSPATDVQFDFTPGNGTIVGDGAFEISAVGDSPDQLDLSFFEGTGTQQLVLNFGVSSGTVTAVGSGIVLYDYTPAMAPTPEPGGLLLLGTGLLGLAGLGWRRFA